MEVKTLIGGVFFPNKLHGNRNTFIFLYSCIHVDRFSIISTWSYNPHSPSPIIPHFSPEEINVNIVNTMHNGAIFTYLCFILVKCHMRFRFVNRYYYRMQTSIHTSKLWWDECTTMRNFPSFSSYRVKRGVKKGTVNSSLDPSKILKPF